MDEQTVEKIQMLITLDKIDEAIYELIEVIPKESENYNHVVLQASKFRRTKKDNLDGIIDRKEYNLELSKIRKSLLEIIAIVKEEELVKKEDSSLNIVRFHLKENRPLPIYTVLISNNGNKSQVIFKLEVDILSYNPYMSIPKTRELESITIWDIHLPYDGGKFNVYPPSPVIIAKDDATMIDLRFSCTYHRTRVHPSETGRYLLKIKFITDKGVEVTTETFSL